MALKFGWSLTERRESIWRGDDALGTVPAAALAAWNEDGDASHLAPHVKPGAKATRIEFRTLTVDEAQFCQGLLAEGGVGVAGFLRAYLMAFRMAVDFPDAPEMFTDAEGVNHRITETHKGYRVLADGFVRHLQHSYPGMTMFYGRLLFDASIASESEKKASSPQSTPMPSVTTTASPGVTVAASEAA